MKQQLLEKEIAELREVNERLRRQNEDLKEALLDSLGISLALAERVDELNELIPAY